MCFANKTFITSGSDLIGYLRKCKTCYNSVHKGVNIIHYTDLDSLQLPKVISGNQKTVIILNTEIDRVGHWMILLLIQNRFSSLAMYIDSLNKIRYDNPRLYGKVKTFCKTNNLKLKDLSFRMQDPTSKCCGFHVLHLTAKFCHTSFHTFYDYVKMMKKNPFRINDRFSIRFVEKHYT